MLTPGATRTVFRWAVAALAAGLLGLTGCADPKAPRPFTIGFSQCTTQDAGNNSARQLEQRNQILARSEQAAEANRTKEQFFTNISHEFRTPLTSQTPASDLRVWNNPEIHATFLKGRRFLTPRKSGFRVFTFNGLNSSFTL